MTDDDALRAAAAAFAKRWGRLLGVVLCSGSANPFGSVRRREWTDAANVTAPKVAGSLNVVRLAKAEGAHFVVLVSSIAGAMPEAGRGLVDYALANAYQLALAERESDGPTVVTAHAWPAWAGVGMRADASFAATHAISAEQALRAFTSYLRAGGSVIFPEVHSQRPRTRSPHRSQPLARRRARWLRSSVTRSWTCSGKTRVTTPWRSWGWTL